MRAIQHNLSIFYFYRSYFNNTARENLPFLVQKLGGVDDFIIDLFGQKFDICDSSDGWDQQQLNRVLGLELSTHFRMSWIPR